MTIYDVQSLRDIEHGLSLSLEKYSNNLEKETDEGLREYYMERIENITALIMETNKELHWQIRIMKNPDINSNTLKGTGL